MAEKDYALTFSVDYPDRDLEKVSTFFRFFAAIPIWIVLAMVSGSASGYGEGGYYVDGVLVAGGLLFGAPLVMLLFQSKYPAWWAEWNRELMRFANRVGIYIYLMDDKYPSTDDQQSVHLDFDNPDGQELSSGLPLIKWFLAIPHYIVLFFLHIAAFFVVIFAWFAILFTGRYPRGAFDFVEGVFRWSNRVIAYMFILVTDQYPPFSLK
jgi:hypothetical protein